MATAVCYFAIFLTAVTASALTASILRDIAHSKSAILTVADVEGSIIMPKLAILVALIIIILTSMAFLARFA